MARLLGLLLLVLASGCATLALGPRLEGQSGPVAWRATDLKIETRTIQGEPREVYSFVLVLREMQGDRLTFTKMERVLSKHGSQAAMTTDTGRWTLQPRGEFRLPLWSYFYCRLPGECLDDKWNAPLWRVVFSGTNESGQSTRVTMDIALPADPASSLVQTAKAPAGPAKTTTAPPGKPSSPTSPAVIGAPTEKPLAPTLGRMTVSTVPIQVVENVVLVPATLNRSHGATLLLDTGASHTVLTPALAARLNLTAPPGGPKRSVTVFGGQKVEIPFIRLPALEIGDVTLVDIEVGVHAVAPDSPIIDGILGGDVLSRYRVTVDHATRQLRLEGGAR